MITNITAHQSFAIIYMSHSNGYIEKFYKLADFKLIPFSKKEELKLIEAINKRFFLDFESLIENVKRHYPEAKAIYCYNNAEPIFEIEFNKVNN